MSIPKVIHYCWFGRGKMPPIAKKCLKSWKRYCPDYEIVCWNEDNFDLTQNTYMLEAYKAGKWAFVSDYVRLKVIYDHGGIYLDTDVELRKPLDPLLEYSGYLGFDENDFVATGIGYGAEAGNEVVGLLLKDYDDLHFVLPDGSYDLLPCTNRNTLAMKRVGFDTAIKDQFFMGTKIFPRDYFCPMDYYTGKKTITKNTYSIHHYCASWTSTTTKRTTFIKRIIGVNMYNKLYGKFLHKLKWLEW